MAGSLSAGVRIVIGGVSAALALSCGGGGGAPQTPLAVQAASPVPRHTPVAALRRDLAADEAAGGHTLARHVGRTDRELRERLRRERGISAASTYEDRSVAERVVGETISGERARIDAWLARQGPRPNLVLDYRGSPSRPVGRSLARGDPSPRSAWDAVVVLGWDGDDRFHVITSYPEAPR